MHYTNIAFRINKHYRTGKCTDRRRDGQTESQVLWLHISLISYININSCNGYTYVCLSFPFRIRNLLLIVKSYSKTMLTKL